MEEDEREMFVEVEGVREAGHDACGGGWLAGPGMSAGHSSVWVTPVRTIPSLPYYGSLTLPEPATYRPGCGKGPGGWRRTSSLQYFFHHFPWITFFFFLSLFLLFSRFSREYPRHLLRRGAGEFIPTRNNVCQSFMLSEVSSVEDWLQEERGTAWRGERGNPVSI